jgi:hypothetical protein
MTRQEDNRGTSKMRPKIHRAALLLLLLPAAALAQTAAPPAPAPDSPERAAAREKMRAACGADVQKFCAGIERAKGAMRTCLDQHQNELSAACQTARAERAAVRSKEKR